MVFHKQLGDMVLLQPALEFLARNADVSLSCRPGIEPLVELMPSVRRHRSAWFESFDEVYAFEPSSRAWKEVLKVRSPRKTLHLWDQGRTKWFHSWIYREIAYRNLGETYVAEHYQFSVGQSDPNPPTLSTPDKSWFPENLPSTYILVNPVAAWKRKCWTVEGWRAVLKDLSKQLSDHQKIYVTGGFEEWQKKHVEEICEEMPHSVVNLAGQTSLKNYIALLSRAELVVTVDGAATHLTQGFHRPSLTLFGPSNPIHWCRVSEMNPFLAAADYSQERKPSASYIPADAVIEQIRILLEKSRRAC